MTNKFAVLIDAGFAKRKLKSITQKTIKAQDFTRLIDSIKRVPYLQDRSLYRVFYYDAPPSDEKLTNPLSGELSDLSNTKIAIDNKKLLAELKTLPFFALRMGKTSTNGSTWKLKTQKIFKPVPGSTSVNLTADDIIPNISQKGVDMKIGLDMATLSLKKQVGAIVLVTGDSDFVPAIKLARTEGVQIFLVNIGHRVKPELEEHIDVMLDLDLTTLS